MFLRDLVWIILIFVISMTSFADDLFTNDESNLEVDSDILYDPAWQFDDDAGDPLAPLELSDETLLFVNDDLSPLVATENADTFDLDSSFITDTSCSSESGLMRKKRGPDFYADPSKEGVLEPQLSETWHPTDMDEKEFAAHVQGADLASTAGSDAENGCPSVEPFVPRYMVCDSGRRK